MNRAEQIKAAFPEFVVEALGAECIVIKREGLLKIAAFLKSDPAFQMNMLMDLFGVDYLHWEEKAARFEVVINLYSSVKRQRLFVKVALAEKDPAVDSVTSIWPAANWYEREAWDMFGILFKGHPNLKRILMYDEFKGHALRKDYAYNRRQPLIGPVN